MSLIVATDKPDFSASFLSRQQPKLALSPYSSSPKRRARRGASGVAQLAGAALAKSAPSANLVHKLTIGAVLGVRHGVFPFDLRG
jgi:hypothetical protein